MLSDVAGGSGEAAAGGGSEGSGRRGQEPDGQRSSVHHRLGETSAAGSELQGGDDSDLTVCLTGSVCVIRSFGLQQRRRSASPGAETSDHTHIFTNQQHKLFIMTQMFDLLVPDLLGQTVFVWNLLNLRG